MKFKSQIALGFLVLAFACTDMDHTYQRFWEDGEIIYPAPADSVKIFPGNERIRLEWVIFGDPNVTSANVFWNYEADSLSVPIQSTGNGDTIRVMLNELEEGSYAFTIYTYDYNGNKSVPVDVVGRSYGETYINSLLIRLIENSFYAADSLTIAWGDPVDDTSIGSELFYNGPNGEEYVVKVAPDADTTVIKGFDFNANPNFNYRTAFLPDSLSLDTFYTYLQSIRVKGPVIELPKTNWTATASSFDDRSGASYRPPENTIDGNLNTLWVNQISPQTDYPHTLTIDMGATQTVDGITLICQKRNETPALIKLQVSADGEEWDTMDNFAVQNVANVVQYFEFSEPQSIRYFKMIAMSPSGSTKNIAIPEIGAFTR